MIQYCDTRRKLDIVTKQEHSFDMWRWCRPFNAI